MFGKYRIVELIGSGASSMVYLARHEQLQVDRAIKCIARNDRNAQQFRTEAKLLKDLSHPGIPLIYDIEEDEDNFYIIEEYIPGESFRTVLSQSNFFPKAELIKISIQICEILEYLHSYTPSGIAYRDLKPENVYISEGRVKLLDFGVSGTKEDDAIYGTPGFAAPEQYRGERAETAADVYSLGALLFYALEGKVYDGGEHSRIWWAGRGIKGNIYKFFNGTLREDPANRLSISQAKEYLVKENKDLIGDEKKSDMHLGRKYIVVSARIGSGGSYLAIALTCYLNSRGENTCYVNEDCKNNWLNSLLGSNEHVYQKSGKIICGNFMALSAKERESSENLVLDFGTDLELALEEQDYEETILIVLGPQLWDKARGFELHERLHSYSNVIYVCSFGQRQMAADYARIFGRKVYCFPLDEDIWRENRTKSNFFKMLERERRD